MVTPKQSVPRVLLVAATTGYQTRMFCVAARRLGVELVLATDRCDQFDDPWRDGAIPIRFYDEGRSVRTVVESTASRSLDGVVAVGDRPAVIGALTARALDLPFHPPNATRIAANKLMTRVCLREAGLVGPWFRPVSLDVGIADLLDGVTYPCVIKPLGLTASRGVMRANTPSELETAAARLARLLTESSIRALRDPANEMMLVEEYLAGDEVAIEGLVTHSELRVLSIFEKPNPLKGPFFEESVYVTSSSLTELQREEVVRQVDASIKAIGLTHGSVHVECRLSGTTVVVLEVAARPIGGLCSKVLKFDGPNGAASFEEILLRHALGQSLSDYQLISGTSAVTMIPVPNAGIYKGVTGVEIARALPLVEDVIVTAKLDQRFVPWPEGASYPGFVFARGDDPTEVVKAVRKAHRTLKFDIEPEIPITSASD